MAAQILGLFPNQISYQLHGSASCGAGFVGGVAGELEAVGTAELPGVAVFPGVHKQVTIATPSLIIPKGTECRVGKNGMHLGLLH